MTSTGEDGVSRSPPEGEQLAIEFEPEDDGLSWHDWFMSLPRKPQEASHDEPPSEQDNRPPWA